MKYQIERLSPDLATSMEQMFRDYYADTQAHVGLPEYKFAWHIYAALSIDRKLVIATARDAGARLLGVNMYILMEHPHHTGLMMAECDCLATAPSHRGLGIGRKLVELGERVLKQKGIQRVVHHYRTVYDAEPLFPKIGYTLAEHVYTKDLLTW